MCRKKNVACVLFFSFFLLFYNQVSAETLDISITPDKAAYAKNEIAYLTVHIANNTDKTAANVQIKNLLPEGLVYVSPSEAERMISSIGPGQEAMHIIRLRIPTLPQTGDNATPILWGVLMLAVLSLFAWLMRHRSASGANR